MNDQELRLNFLIDKLIDNDNEKAKLKGDIKILKDIETCYTVNYTEDSQVIKLFLKALFPNNRIIKLMEIKKSALKFDTKFLKQKLTDNEWFYNVVATDIQLILEDEVRTFRKKNADIEYIANKIYNKIFNL